MFAAQRVLLTTHTNQTFVPVVLCLKIGLEELTRHSNTTNVAQTLLMQHQKFVDQFVRIDQGLS